MTEVTATVQRAAQWAGEDPDEVARWNPVYRALVDGSGTPPERSPGPQDAPAAGIDLVRRQLSAPALLVVAVTEAGRTRHLRIGLAPGTGTMERADGEGPSQWTELAAQQVPSTVCALLEESGIDLSPAQLEIGSGEDVLRLTPQQICLAREALAAGVPAEEAFSSLPELDDALRDALSATGPRLSLSLTLHDPRGRVAEEPVTWSRLWVTGRDGMYRMDRPASAPMEVRPVGGGDVLGTLLPILEQGLLFAAEATAAGGAR